MSKNPITFTSDIAVIYEKYMAPIFFISTSQDLVNRIGSAPKKILEIAAGTGQVTRRLAEKFPEAEIFATDFNPGMINTGKEIVKNTNVLWQEADACELPFKDNIFDLVICQFGFMFFPNKQKAMDEAYRVLKPGGKLLYNTWDSLENNRICLITDEVLKSVFPVDPPPFFHLPYSMYDENEMNMLAQNSGFKDTVIIKLDVKGFSESAENVVTAFTKGNPVHLQILERDPALLPVFKNRLFERMTAEYGTGSFEIPLKEIIVSSIK